MTLPSDVLTEPSLAGPFPPLVEAIMDAGSLLSPTHWIRTGLEWGFGYNPVSDVVKYFSGDWEATARASRALEVLGAYHSEMSAEIKASTTRVAGDWEGNASDATQAYFAGLAVAVDAQNSALQDIAHQYNAVAVGMKEAGNAVESLFEWLLDTIILWVAAEAAAAIAAATVVGALVGAVGGSAATAAAIARIISIAKDILKGFEWAWNVVHVFVASTAGFLGALQGFQGVELPGAYDFKGV